MASNPYVNKVEYAGQTIMDLTGDTATPSDVLAGATFHDRSGSPQTGNLITHSVYDGLDSTSVSDALSANQGRVLNQKVTIPSALGEFSSVSALSDALDGFVSNMDSYSFSQARFTFSATEYPFISSYIYYGSVYKGASTGNYCHAVFYANASIAVISGYKTTGSWVFESLADRTSVSNQISSAIGDHYGSLGSSSNPVTSRGSIPLNWVGNVVFDSSISPSGVTRSHSVIKFGLSDNRYNIIAVDQYSYKTYIFEYYDGTNKGWRSLDPDSVYSYSTNIIPDNSSLNNYNTPGVYTIRSSTSAQTISNCPVTTSGGRLEVIGQNSNSGYIRQIYYPSGTVTIYSRIRASDSGTSWAQWYAFTPTAV